MREESREGMGEEEFDQLFKLSMEKKWHQVVRMYKANPCAHKTKLTISDETALHVCISSFHSKTPKIAIYIDQMMEVMEHQGTLTQVLSMPNARGDTPLHLAAAVGSAAICERIASKRPHIIFARNVNGETPMFVAAHLGNLQSFLCLHELYTRIRDPKADARHQPLRRSRDGDTVLHKAISGEYLRLAYQIVCYYPSLTDSVNVDGESPLHVLAKMPNIFKSSGHLHLYDSITYHCVFVDKLKRQKYDSRCSHVCDSYKLKNFPANYKTCVDILYLIWSLILIVTTGRKSCDEGNQPHREKKPSMAGAENGGVTVKDERGSRKQNGGFFPANYATCLNIFKFAMKIILTILGLGFGRIKKIKDKKERHCHALEMMNIMIDYRSTYKYDSNGQQPPGPGGIHVPDKRTPDDDDDINEGLVHVNKEISPILLAAKMGILEMVKRIMSKCPVAIQDVDSERRNVLMLAAEYRQTSVFDYLLGMNLPKYVFHQLDNQENNILHLAAKLGEAQPWRIPGAALQMQWEIKWYKHVKRSVSPLSLNHPNLNGETPRMILTKTHKKLMKTGNAWLIKTSESCSVVAALIATVAFASSTTVPGGLDQDTGYPILRDHTAFDIFSIGSLVALCLSITALVFFLAIITSRHEERDFKRNLPRKLLMGLTCLFSSIATMLTSFCAGHTFILRDELRRSAVPIYAFSTLPVAYFAMAQLPLYFDLLWAACRKVPLRSYKVVYP